MKLMIASDIHGAAGYCRDLLSAFDREGAARLLLLGDILYHGPRNDLPDEYAPKQVLAMLNERRDRLFCVRGNCDTEVDQMVLNFPILADYSIFPVGNRLIYATHGHVYNTAHLPPLCPGDILLHGHTCTRVGAVRRGKPLFEPRLCLHSEKRLRTRLSDAGRRRFSVENAFRRRIPYAHAVIWCLYTAKTGFPSNPFDGKPVVCLPVHSPLTL